MTKITHKEKHIFKEGQKLLSTGAVDPLVRLPKWAQRRIAELEEQVKRAEATTPWTAPGMEWFTLFWPGPEPKVRAPQRLFTCGDDGTHCVCTLGPDDYVFVGRGKKPNRTITMQRNDPAHRTPGAEHNQRRNTMKKWTVINQHDGNDTFEVEGDNYGEAACDALQQLGWAISIPESDDDES